jgi:hypothetical protein
MMTWVRENCEKVRPKSVSVGVEEAKRKGGQIKFVRGPNDAMRCYGCT